MPQAWFEPELAKCQRRLFVRLIPLGYLMHGIKMASMLDIFIISSL